MHVRIKVAENPAVQPFDPPAAHSMDTTWFAVDQSGVVARFETGEAGALPNSAAIGASEAEATIDYERFDEWVLARHWARQLEVDAGRVENPHLATEADRAVLAIGGGSYRGEQLVADDEVVVLRAEPRIVVTREPMTPDRLNALRGHESVLRFEYAAAVGEDEEPRARELFVFHNQDYDTPGAYVLGTEPEVPVTLDELPVELRGPIASLRLPVRFAETHALQLANYMGDADVQVWGDIPLAGPTEEALARAREPTLAAPKKSPLPIVALLVAIALLTWWLLTR